MDENHQDMPGSKPLATEEIKWVLNKKSNLLVPARTGFEDKTRWDWLQLILQAITAIAIPLSIIALIIGVWQFNVQQQADREKTLEQQQADRANLIDQQEQTTLDTYLDRMSDLLFAGKLLQSQPGNEVRSVARARTMSALQNLNLPRKVMLLQFLYQSNLIQRPQANDKGFNPIIDLTYANLRDADLHAVLMVGANLSNIDLYGANASNADLNRANLLGSSLALAVMKQVGLAYANLQGAIIIGTNLQEAFLVKADLRGANLSGANLQRAYMYGTDLSGVSLCGAYPFYMDGKKVCADLSGAHLEGANMRYKTAYLTESILKGAEYNTKPFRFTDPFEDIVVTLGPTQWPRYFNPKAAGAICVDC